MLTSLISTLLLAAFLQYGAGAPQKRDLIDPDPTGSLTAAPTLIAAPTHHCVQIHHPYCSQLLPGVALNALFPNPRGHVDFGEAAFEFSHFARLLDTGCSDKLGTLLCFLYFPFCAPHSDLTVMPCRSVCEEVTRDCADILDELAAEAGETIVWSDLQHFNCSNYDYTINGEKRLVYYEESGNQCAHQDQPPWIPGMLEEDSTPTETKSTEAESSNSDSEEEEETSETKPTEVDPSEAEKTPVPTDEDDETPETEETPSEHTEQPTCPTETCAKCDIRAGANGNSFVNNDYDFAFKCKLNSKALELHDCNWALNCTVQEQFDIRSERDNCSLAPQVTPNTPVLILGPNKECTNCFDIFKSKLDLAVNGVYLIAGVRDTQHDGTVWRLPGSQTTSLIVEWDDNKFAHTKKRNKMITTHICKGNKKRDCLREECS